MDFKRIFSGFIVGMTLIIILIIPNNFITALCFTVITLIAMNEYLNAISKICKPVKWMGYLSCISVLGINYISEQYINIILLSAIPIVLFILFAQVIITDMKTTFKDIAYTFFGICYISSFMMFLSLINEKDNGKILLLYAFMAGWVTDTGAYVIGKRLGKHKFSKISPKKSIEGCIAGTFSAFTIMMLFTVVLNNCFSYEISYLAIGLSALLLSLIGQIGDFSASVIKRYVDIKDYSNLLPGHGGIIDRMDSILFIAPFAYIIFTLIRI